jgi:hypothetical protein
MMVKDLERTSTLYLALVPEPKVLRSERPIMNKSATMQLPPEVRPVIWTILVTEVAISRETTCLSH